MNMKQKIIENEGRREICEDREGQMKEILEGA